MDKMENHLIGKSQANIAGWQERIARIDAGYVEYKEKNSSGVIDVTADTRAEMVDLIALHEGVIARLRGAKGV